ncbi:MAG: hypothetical protein KAG98_03510 [Lentisphaeria bacterium]|nr:hypothetical protein [Lentisphaeria bacterium]
MTDPSIVTKDYLVHDIEQLGVNEAVRKYRNALLPSKVIAELYDDEIFPHLAKLFIVSYPNSPSRLLVKIANESQDFVILEQLANHPRSSRDILLKLAKSEDYRIRKILAINPKISPEVVSLLSHDANPTVRAALAEKGLPSENIQLLLSKDEHPLVRSTLALSKKLGSGAQEILRHDSDFLVKFTMINLLKCSDDYLLAIADSDQPSDQLLVLQREELPDKVLESLALSKDDCVRFQAIKRKVLEEDELVGLAEDNSLPIRKLMASLPDLPDFVQHLLCQDEFEVQLVLATSFVSADAAINLIETGDERLLEALAVNVACPQEIVTLLAKMAPLNIVELISLRSDLEASQFDIIINSRADLNSIYNLSLSDCGFDDLTEEITLRLAKERSSSLRAFSAASKNINDEVVKLLINDRVVKVRETLVNNKLLENDELKVMMNDSDPEIAARAAELESIPAPPKGVKGFMLNILDKVKRR